MKNNVVNLLLLFCFACIITPANALDFTPTFQINTDAITTAGEYSFAISASGTFYIDCGDGGTLRNSAHTTQTSPFTRNSATGETYYCYLPVNADGYTISFAGSVNGYNNASGSSYNVSAISFYTGQTRKIADIIKTVSGSLSAIFPTLDDGSTLAKQPRFIYTFYNATKFVGPLSSSLFSGLHGPFAAYMFRRTFYSNTSLTGYVPYNFFADLETAQANMSKVLKDIFKGNNTMQTSCQSGTEAYTLSYAGYLNGKAVCKPLSACNPNEYEYDGNCYAKCTGTNMNELKLSSGLSYNMVATKPTTPAMNIQYNNIICYIPLENGIGTSPALNVQYGGNTYHTVSLN